MGLTVARRALAFLVQFSLCLVRSKCWVYCRPPLPLEARFHRSETFPKLYLLLALLGARCSCTRSRFIASLTCSRALGPFLCVAARLVFHLKCRAGLQVRLI